MKEYCDLKEFINLDKEMEIQIQERYTSILLTYFAKLFGEVIFLDWQENKNGSYSYYIHDRENLEGVYEIRYDVFAILVLFLKKMNPKYYEQLTKIYFKGY